MSRILEWKSRFEEVFKPKKAIDEEYRDQSQQA